MGWGGTYRQLPTHPLELHIHALLVDTRVRLPLVGLHLIGLCGPQSPHQLTHLSPLDVALARLGGEVDLQVGDLVLQRLDGEGRIFESFQYDRVRTTIPTPTPTATATPTPTTATTTATITTTDTMPTPTPIPTPTPVFHIFTTQG